MTIPSSRSLIFEVKCTGSELAFIRVLRLRKTSDVFGRLRTSSGIFWNDRAAFKNPSTPRIKIPRLYLRKSWQVYIPWPIEWFTKKHKLLHSEKDTPFPVQVFKRKVNCIGVQKILVCFIYSAQFILAIHLDKVKHVTVEPMFSIATPHHQFRLIRR